MGIWSKFFKRVKAPTSTPRKMIFFNIRYGVYTAYLDEDYPDVGGMLAPSPGLMIFTEDEQLPKTARTLEDLRQLAQATDRDLVEVSEYAFYTLGRGCVPKEQDVADYGHHVLSWNQALARAQA